ncbi:hypothetical protein B0I37DRAFT_223029 [Chaetomium sp. MPI-CAGE-AT-0009]|nr:hypothetical protein B0I37DRAFT_223029 [Chaetomium sp. MPI-CAGE-AT-0009]
MPSLFTITEPHPTVPQDSYTHSGRGGLGNFFRAPATTSPSGVPTPSTSGSRSSSTRRFYSGRGGAGNAHASSSSTHTPALAFDEDEIARRAELREPAAVVGYVGRGGAGNVFYSSSSSKDDAGADDGEALGRRSSASTEGSARSSASASLAGLWGRVKSAGR